MSGFSDDFSTGSDGDNINGRTSTSGGLWVNRTGYGNGVFLLDGTNHAIRLANNGSSADVLTADVVDMDIDVAWTFPNGGSAISAFVQSRTTNTASTSGVVCWSKGGSTKYSVGYYNAGSYTQLFLSNTVGGTNDAMLMRVSGKSTAAGGSGTVTVALYINGTEDANSPGTKSVGAS